jgi:hypothetical protein
MIKKLLIGTAAFSLLITTANAQRDFSSLKKKQTSQSTYNWEAPTISEKGNNDKSQTISTQSGYYITNANIIRGANGYSADPLKVWPAGLTGGGTATFTQAEQFVPNTASLTIDSLFFLGAAMDNVSAEAVVVITDKTFTPLAFEFVTVSTFGQYQVKFTTPVALADSFWVQIIPRNTADDSLVVAVTNDYLPTLPYDGNGLFVENDNNTGAFVNLYGPGDGGGDWVIWPSVTYTLEDVTADKNCLTGNNDLVTFSSQNEGLLTNPLWNYNAWAEAQGAPVTSGYFYTQVEIAQQSVADSNQVVGYSYTFPTPGMNTVNYTERLRLWYATGTSATINQTTVFNLDICTGINTIEANTTSVYPNPAQNRINFKVSNVNTILNIVDLTGKLVIAEQLNSKLNTINVSNLENGFYIFSLTSSNGDVSTGNFVISK